MTLYLYAFLLGFTAERSCHFALKGWNAWRKHREQKRIKRGRLKVICGEVVGGRYQK